MAMSAEHRSKFATLQWWRLHELLIFYTISKDFLTSTNKSSTMICTCMTFWGNLQTIWKSANVPTTVQTIKKNLNRLKKIGKITSENIDVLMPPSSKIGGGGYCHSVISCEPLTLLITLEQRVSELFFSSREYFLWPDLSVCINIFFTL